MIGVSEDLAIGPELCLELVDVQGVNVCLPEITDRFMDSTAEYLFWS